MITVRKLILALLAILALNHYAEAQRYLADLDSLLFFRDSARPVIKRFENLRFTGYIQPQYQKAESKGASSYEGGNFSPQSDSRFMLRRARIKVDYFVPSKQRLPKFLFTFQIDATERGVNVRDMFLKMYENKYNNFSLTTGLFARPYGFEINLSSSYRESPERGRMSQILMPSERDLGAMLSFEPQDQSNPLSFIKWDAGIFNGQGLSGTTDFDGYKDIISRIYLRPRNMKNIVLSGGASLLYGGWIQASKFVYTTGKDQNGQPFLQVDSSISNIGEIAPRRYYGADAQIIFRHQWGETELRGEYWWGTQPGTQFSTGNPGSIPVVNGNPSPVYLRKFDGAFFYFLQNLFSKKHQLIIKYDRYDPNKEVDGSYIGSAGLNFTEADIRYQTLGIGYIYYFDEQLKTTIYYSMPSNESTSLPGFRSNLDDRVLTIRLQFRF